MFTEPLAGWRDVNVLERRIGNQHCVTAGRSLRPVGEDDSRLRPTQHPYQESLLRSV